MCAVPLHPPPSTLHPPALLSSLALLSGQARAHAVSLHLRPAKVYPRSFLDGCTPNCTGIGSLSGVTSKLSYLRDTVGVTALWLSPIYERSAVRVVVALVALVVPLVRRRLLHLWRTLVAHSGCCLTPGVDPLLQPHGRLWL